MEKHPRKERRSLSDQVFRRILGSALAFCLGHNIGCATVEMEIDDTFERDTIGDIAEDSSLTTDSHRSEGSDSTPPEETESAWDSEEETSPVDSETETDTERDTSSTDIHCPKYSHGWPCTCRKLILGCDDGSECIGLEGLFDQKTGYCAKSCTPKTGLADCETPYGGLGDCRISDASGTKFYCALYCETDFHCPPGQTCKPLPSGLFSVCHP